MKRIRGAVLLAVALIAPAMAQSVDVGKYLKKGTFGDIKLSPNGDYYAATIPFDDRTVLAVLRRGDNKVTASFRLGKNTHVADFWWVNPERVVISIAEKFGALDQPQLTGELYAINADGSRPDILVGFRVQDAGLGTRIQPKKEEAVAAFLVDDLPGDDKNVIITVRPPGVDAYTRAERLNVYTGQRKRITSVPVQNAIFVTDNRGVVRFASGVGTDNNRQLYYRAGENLEWRMFSDETSAEGVEWPIGFSADDRTAYLQIERREGPDAIVAVDLATGNRQPVLRDDDVDPDRIFHRNGTSIPVGAVFMDGKPRTVFFDGASQEARLQRGLEAAFDGDFVRITSQTGDGRLALVEVQSDRNPGDFYVFDTVTKKANYLISRREWFDPAKMAAMQPVRFKVRDGMTVHGYLSIPPGSSGKLPLVVFPHGGPFGRQDKWGFDTEAQMLAAAGYAVLQVNYRGSSGYGRSFMRAGARQWGGAMQDDLTDATRWAIEQGIADGDRICLYGASYGGYAALMGVAKEPSLYRCAVGYVGVYDLPQMQREDAKESRRFANWSEDWVGKGAQLETVSPNRIAGRIKVPVFLAAGGEDLVAPIEHSRLMEKALREAGTPVETLYYETEGHGFYLEEHRREFYTRLLAFLSRHLGGRVAATGGGGTDAAK